jgi:hypothetical protein
LLGLRCNPLGSFLSFLPEQKIPSLLLGLVELWVTHSVVQEARQIHSLKGFLVDLEGHLRYGEKRNFSAP